MTVKNNNQFFSAYLHNKVLKCINFWKKMLITLVQNIAWF